MAVKGTPKKKVAPVPAVATRTGGPSSTKLRLLETMIDLIWEHNYTSVSVDDICRRAGVLKGSFYHFFPSKAELAVDALEERWVRLVQPRLARAFAPSLTPFERLSAYYDMVYENQRVQKERIGKTCGCPFATVGSEQSNEDQKIRSKSQEILERYILLIETAVRDAVREGSVEDLTLPGVPDRARELFSFVLGILLLARVQNDLLLVKRSKAAFLRLSGLRQAVAA